ncbi:MAG: mechanosensitive ion channel [Actinomycetota bacterium]|nr:mechanosensitive ion channel [Actinomycetota bacterium]
MPDLLDPLIDLLREHTPLVSPWARVAAVVALFGGAWLVSRGSAYVARLVLGWHDRVTERSAEATRKITDIKRRETLVALIRTAIAYSAFAGAAVLSLAQLIGGIDRLAAIAGGLFFVLVGVFVAQRVLTDIIAGLEMFLEGWYSVGDTILLHCGTEHQGVVEDVSLRRTKLRALNGELIHVHNAQIDSVRVLPGGVKELAIELFVSDREAGESLVAEIRTLLPEGPTTFAKRPWVESVDELSPGLARITLHATVAPGREWLAEGFLADLLKEKARDGLIVHGPVTLAVDERALRSFARASAATRWSFRQAERRQSQAAA